MNKIKRDYFGTCLVNGHHSLDSELAKECPVVRAEIRRQGHQRRWETRRKRADTANRPHPETGEEFGRPGSGEGQDAPANDS